ncbi:DnaB-like helicase C-terminal domain-containing protein [Halomonas sp. BMC6]|uniref:DnaB-like helicase C-terminal domain-containing protein n=1 Tax=Halomonas sp. BMC6 TaxID=3073244 RepID=UPI0030CFB04C
MSVAHSVIETIGAATAAPSGTGVPSPFTPEFELKIVSHTLRDTSFLQQCEDLVDRDFFSDASSRFLVTVAKNHYKKYESAPSIRTLTSYVQSAVKSGKVKKELIPDIKQTLKEAYDEPLSDLNYLIERVTTFARHRALQAALFKVVEDMERAEKLGVDLDYGVVEREFQSALMTGSNDANNGYDYFERLSDRTEAREDRASGKIDPSEYSITTGYPAIDSLLYHKGWARKEMVVFMGPPKSGKSTALGQFGINACRAGFDVLYVSLEVSDLVLADRIDASLSSVAMAELTDKSTFVRDEIEKLSGSCGKFMLHQYPTMTFTPKQLARLIEYYKARGVVFDMIIVDYGDIMAPDFRTPDPIENSKSIYAGLRAIAMQYDAALLTATQTNRDGARSSVATMTDVAEDFNKIRIADLVISINKTEEEKAAQEARLYFAASRNQRGDITIRIKQDLEKMKFLTKILDVS